MSTVLETPRLLLRTYDEGDLGALHEIVSDPVTMQFWPQPFQLGATKSWLSRALASYREHGLGRWAVMAKESGRLVGDCGYLRVEVAGVLEVDLGYIFAKDVWGRGLATEAASACLHHGLFALGLPRVVANMEARHLASRRVAEKIGLRFEREFRNARNRGLPTCVYATSAVAFARAEPSS